MTKNIKCHAGLQTIPVLFEERWGKERIEQLVRNSINFLRDIVEKRYPNKEDREAAPEAERKALGIVAFDAIVSSIDTSMMSPFQKFLFWMSAWWYYDPRIRSQLYLDSCKAHEYAQARVVEFVVPVLPENIRNVLSHMEVISVANGFGHFAILFNDKEAKTRRIVTDTGLFELRDVYGYNYIDVSPNGNPFVRCVTGHGGGRTFFDGERLMAHDRFRTCAPKVAFFEGGYKVNSSEVTIVNGALLPLIEDEDAVAHTTGAFMGVTDFSNAQAIESYRLTDETAKRLAVKDGLVHLDNKPLKQMGFFKPSRRAELENGFTLFDYAEFQESFACVYDHILVVDDKAAWIEAVVKAFPDVGRIDRIRTSNSEKALEAIIANNPEVVILDMHLTVHERFDGLWIAREAKKRGYGGRILIASNYEDNALGAMSVLTGGLEAPGKNLDRIKKLLANK